MPLRVHRRIRDANSAMLRDDTNTNRLNPRNTGEHPGQPETNHNDAYRLLT